MPHRKVAKYLQDILTSIEAIERYTIETRSFDAFVSKRMVYRAVERELEIIAEAITRIRNANIEVELSDSKKIVGLRNRVIHAYDNVNEEIIWGVVIKHLPKLKIEVEELMKNF